MTSEAKHIVISGNHPVTGLPYLLEPSDLDQWPSEAATQEAIDTLIEIVDRGYAGVKIETYTLSDGRTGFNYYTADSTPEGRMAEGLMALASQGKSQPVNKSLAILERVYREHGLPLPQKQSPLS